MEYQQYPAMHQYPPSHPQQQQYPPPLHPQQYAPTPHQQQYPPPPQQYPHAHPGMGAAPPVCMISVQYMPGNSCASCCPCCCWACGDPTNETSFNIFIDGAEVGTFRQGLRGEFPVAPGFHRVEAREGGVGGFLSGLVSRDGAGSAGVNCAPGSTAHVQIGWEGACCRNRPIPYVRPA